MRRHIPSSRLLILRVELFRDPPRQNLENADTHLRIAIIIVDFHEFLYRFITEQGCFAGPGGRRVFLAALAGTAVLSGHADEDEVLDAGY